MIADKGEIVTKADRVRMMKASMVAAKRQSSVARDTLKGLPVAQDMYDDNMRAAAMKEQSKQTRFRGYCMAQCGADEGWCDSGPHSAEQVVYIAGWGNELPTLWNKFVRGKGWFGSANVSGMFMSGTLQRLRNGGRNAPIFLCATHAREFQERNAFSKKKLVIPTLAALGLGAAAYSMKPELFTGRVNEQARKFKEASDQINELTTPDALDIETLRRSVPDAFADVVNDATALDMLKQSGQLAGTWDTARLKAAMEAQAKLAQARAAQSAVLAGMNDNTRRRFISDIASGALRTQSRLDDARDYVVNTLAPRAALSAASGSVDAWRKGADGGNVIYSGASRALTNTLPYATAPVYNAAYQSVASPLISYTGFDPNDPRVKSATAAAFTPMFRTNPWVVGGGGRSSWYSAEDEEKPEAKRKKVSWGPVVDIE